MRTFGKPMLPRGILHELVELRAGPGGYDPDNGGQWVRSEPERIPFQGVVLVVSEDDWQKAPQGTCTRNSRKIYTTGHALGVGSRVYDPESGATYTVTGDLDHGAIHPLRRFVAERKGEAAPK